jgi:aminopeptidase N
VADPGRDHIFDALVYDRGAMTLQILRKTIGDATFFRLLQDWASEHRYGNVSTQEFIQFAERISHRDLDAFFQIWLYSPGKPAI